MGPILIILFIIPIELITLHSLRLIAEIWKCVDIAKKLDGARNAAVRQQWRCCFFFVCLFFLFLILLSNKGFLPLRSVERDKKHGERESGV